MRIFLFYLIGFFLSCPCAYAYYDIQSYVATFEARENSPDIYVTLAITYNVRDEAKFSGYKSIGNCIVKDVIAKENDKPLKTAVNYFMGTKISWNFPSIIEGEKRVVVCFAIQDGLKGDLRKNKFSAEWVGVFNIPVHNAEYRFLFPAGFQPDFLVVTPSNFSQMDNAIVVIQDKLKDKVFSVAFKPGMVINLKSKTSGIIISYILIGFIILMSFLFMAYLLYYRLTYGGWPLRDSRIDENHKGWQACGNCEGWES
jgi:hypothetical protein